VGLEWPSLSRMKSFNGLFPGLWGSHMHPQHASSATMHKPAKPTHVCLK